MINAALLVSICLLLAVSSSQAPPSWTRDNSIDAGESVAIDVTHYFANTPTNKTAPITFSLTQAFNKTDFTVIPRVALVHLSFDFYYVSSMSMGYRININTITTKNVTYKVDLVGVKTCGLHFMYIAVSPIYDAYYFISFYNQSFTSAQDLANVSAGATRSQTILLNYPKNTTLPSNYSPSAYTLQAWLVWYVFTPANSIAINTTCGFNSATQLQVVVTVNNNFALTQLGLVAVLIDNAGLFQYSYTLYIDQFYNNQVGTNQPINPVSSTITDFNTQYIYRNTISGLTSDNINFISSPLATYFYFNYTSSATSYFTGYAINIRARSCDTTNVYYFYENSTCIPTCPQYYYSNSSYKYCIKCHYSCLNCSAPAAPTACTQCEAAQFRQLVTNTCSCQPHYFDNSTLLCASCYVNCLTCSNQLSNSCLSCDGTLQRSLSNGVCVCSSGYYQNTTCFACSGNCVTCQYTVATSTYVCLTCSLSNNRTLDNSNSSCICLSAFYSAGANCLPCDSGCLNCSGTSACTLCNSAANFTLSNGVCSCLPTLYFQSSNQSCANCFANCLTCSNQLSNGCLSCDGTLQRSLSNGACLCKSGFYENNTCFACSGNCLTCQYTIATSTYVCLTCSLSNNRTLDSTNTSCICLSAYYSAGANCLPCDFACLNCSGPSVCTLCNSNANFVLSNGVCSCSPMLYFQSTNQSCANCYVNCLTCSNQSSSGCLSCDGTLQRSLTNGSCLCSNGYYQNNTCFACVGNCVTCKYITTNSTYVCLTCSLTNNRTLDSTNSSCICLSSYYSAGANCLACDLGCLNCSGASACTLCNSTANFTLSSGVCSCPSTYTLSNSVCLLSTAICGNGILQLSEQCDDDNTQNGDGCSSTCKVQASYTCINNASLYVYSLCYYSGKITLSLEYVYKVPLTNGVQLILSVIAENINQTALQKYLETQTAVVFNAQRRLLFSTINQQNVTYDPSTSKLTVQFTYNSSIELPSVSLQIQPSLSNSTNVKYFYNTPTADITLASPYNKLLTTYIEDDDLHRQTIISWLFLAMIILSWLYLLVAIAYNQAAMAVEFFMILQVTYESLLQSGFIYDGWIGLIVFGKYTYGINADNIISAGPDTLKTLGLTIPLLNTLNATVAICFLTVLIVIVIFVYQMAEISRNTEVVQTKSTEDKLEVARQSAREFNHAAYEVKKGIFLVGLEAGFALTFITCRIVTISMSLAIKEGEYIVSSLLPALVLSACGFVLFLFYHKFFDFQAMTQLSYRRILSNLKKVESDQTLKNLRVTISNMLIKYHYTLIFLLMTIFAIVDACTSMGIGFYLSVAIGALVWWVVIAINGNYLRKVHTVRSAINTICLITTMITLLVQTLNVLTTSQNIIAPLVGLSMLFLSLLFHIAVLVRIEYKRRRKRSYKKRVNKVQNVAIMRQKLDTQVPVEITRNREDNEHIDRSHIDLGVAIKDKDKFDDISVQNDDSQQYTRKKIVADDRFVQSTRHKDYRQPPSPYTGQKMEETVPKGYKAELAEEENEQSEENGIQNKETVVKRKIRKQIDFENY